MSAESRATAYTRLAVWRDSRCRSQVRLGRDNIKHGDQWRNTIATFALPVLGNLIVRDIDTPHILAVLEPLWTETPQRTLRPSLGG